MTIRDVSTSVPNFDTFNDYLEAEANWYDNISNFSSAVSSPAKSPSWELLSDGIHMGLLFSAGDDVHGSYHNNHDILSNSKGYPHIHWMPKTTMAVGETVIWTFNGNYAAGHHQGGTFATGNTSIVLTYTADGTELAEEHMILECSEAQALPIGEVDALFKARIQYTGGTYAGGVYGEKADMHYQRGRIGTPLKVPPFI